MKKKIVILGSTGSIGESTLRVIAALPSRFEVVGIASCSNYRRTLEQAAQFNVPRVAIADPKAAEACAAVAPKGLAVTAGDDGVIQLAGSPGVDLVLCALVGVAGLRSVLAALGNGTTVALATKEVLVSAGQMVMDCAAANRARILPVDSEHSAIFQCLEGRPPESVRRLILTASGGPFAARHELDLEKVTVADALKHPRWNMGRKVTVDSATLMNKGLEIMEARWLFDVPIERIDVLIHPESIIHSLVEFVDGSVLAQLSPPDMRFAIQYALTWPDRAEGGLPPLDLARLGNLHFRPPDPVRFPSLRLARSAALTGGTMPAILNAANEVAVQRFLEGRIPFAGIWKTVEAVMARAPAAAHPSIEAVMAADAWARGEAESVCRTTPQPIPSAGEVSPC